MLDNSSSVGPKTEPFRGRTTPRSTLDNADELAGRPRRAGDSGSRKVRTSQSRVIANGNPR